jgi:Uma2 family endonuclease
MTTLATTPTLPSAPPPAVPDDFIFRLSVDQYHEMIKAGILTSDDPVELLEGWLVQKMPKNPAHRLAKRLFRDALAAALPPGWHVEEQEPVTTSDSEPEPDVTVIRGTPRDYAQHHPGPADLALVVEVSDSTLRRDRGRKKRIYARAGVPVYWIVNLPDRRVEVYTGPSGLAETPDYGQRQEFGPSESVPVIIDGTEVGRLTVADLLP